MDKSKRCFLWCGRFPLGSSTNSVSARAVVPPRAARAVAGGQSTGTGLWSAPDFYPFSPDLLQFLFHENNETGQNRGGNKPGTRVTGAAGGAGTLGTQERGCHMDFVL